MRKYLLLTSILVSLLFSTPANAHVLIADDTKQVGAVLHITPDDDPVAGEPSTLFFDIQSDAVTQQTHSFALKIVRDDGTEALVPITVVGSSVSATYTFPAQAAYDIILSADPLRIGDPVLRFLQAQRVSRGISTTGQTDPVHTWAEAGVIASLCGLAVLGIMTINKREVLAAYIRSQK